MAFAEGTPTEKVTLGGKVYEIGWTWAAKRRARECLAARDPKATNEEDQMAAALWSSLDKEARSTLTLEDVEELINPGNEEAIGNTLRALVSKSEPEPDPNAKPGAATKPTPGERKPVSTSSGQLASTT